jgi:cbb3-type cytochrome oxidase maturation protein
MSVLFVLVPVVMLVVAVAVLAYVWAAGRGQFDDLVTPAIRAVQDDAPEGAPGPPPAAEPPPTPHG